MQGEVCESIFSITIRAMCILLQYLRKTGAVRTQWVATNANGAIFFCPVNSIGDERVFHKCECSLRPTAMVAWKESPIGLFTFPSHPCVQSGTKVAKNWLQQPADQWMRNLPAPEASTDRPARESPAAAQHSATTEITVGNSLTVVPCHQAETEQPRLRTR